MTNAAERLQILVFGSINADLVARVAAIPRPGETVLSQSYVALCGGKGANQAVAAARMSPAGTVAMVGRVGDDAFGHAAIENLRQNGVDTGFVRFGAEPTGCAFIAVNGSGENAITVAAGANGALAAADLPAALLGAGTVVVLQMEVPFAPALTVARRCRAAGGRVLWNFAPASAEMTAADLRALLDATDLFIANEHEMRAAAILLGDPLLGEANSDASAAAASVGRGGNVIAILTAGAGGATAFYPDRGNSVAPALDIRPVDTTGAGDTFVGILAAELAAGTDLARALRGACIGASLACLAAGAQTAMPTRPEVEAHL